ncbi:KAP family NTPase [Pseudomonas xanthosomatis]|uniref:antiviral RADAR system adenosine triphosphatase RdrA n=1 Tax=Pseudomonas xanthosomatis TaxID=2842356 RepID=UPI001C3C52FC|nr:antiviral RADAR system adenosine triphosphatase RdrA [Pseudomonas xanthosomatis]QXH48359.1 KAP family NTPase [Pseudomonas xanthosomatis]
MTPRPKTIIEVPIEQVEQARQVAINNLLAQEVYEKIRRHLTETLARLPEGYAKSFSDLDDHRSHEAILIDGGRGTGKSSVLVNLATYLQHERDFLILKPVDPTLLENGDDLLLNVIVAALMRDKSVKHALQHNEQGAESFYDQLHKLGAALEGIQTQKDKYGLDKLRAFMSDQALAEQVHELFRRVLALVDKKVVVLPIDDVDTSLSLAFENIEVVRKYLTSPFVIPLISGDLNLYNEIIWRQFYQRLTSQARDVEDASRQRARDLAEDYQRKVLPLPKRIELPQLTTYLDDPNIMLTAAGRALFPLPILQHWLDALLNERVNGEGNSRQRFPLKTVREMSQFINATKGLIVGLPAQLGLSPNMLVDVDAFNKIKRSLFMSDEISEAVQVFADSYRKAQVTLADGKRTSRTERERAYSALRRRVQSAKPALREGHREHLQQWYEAIAGYFRYQRRGGAAYLTAETSMSWLSEGDASDDGTVLNHDLFQPLNHNQKIFENFDLAYDARKSWNATLKGFVPDLWLERLPEKTILAYPTPERGYPVSTQKTGPWALSQHVKKEKYLGDAEFVRRLLVHWSFFSPSKRSNLVLGGRVFELLIMSMVRDVSYVEIAQLLDRAPFHSVAALADTKSLTVSDSDAEAGGVRETVEPPLLPDEEYQEDQLDAAIIQLASDINSWRKDLSVQVPPSWLVYNVMNKVFNQTHYIYTAASKGDSDARLLRNMVDLGVQIYNAIWAAFGSFEKGELFGFPRVIANVNMTEAGKEFEKSVLYRQNILPFLHTNRSQQSFDFRTGSYTFALESHPLRELLSDVFSEFDSIEAKAAVKESSSISQGEYEAESSRRLSKYVANYFRGLAATEIRSMDPVELHERIEGVYRMCQRAGIEAAFRRVPNETGIARRMLRVSLEQFEKLTGLPFHGLNAKDDA